MKIPLAISIARPCSHFTFWRLCSVFSCYFLKCLFETRKKWFLFESSYHSSDIQVLEFYNIRAYFTQIKCPGIGHFVKSALFEEKIFFLEMKLIKSNFQLGGIHPPPVCLNCVIAPLSNKVVLVKSHFWRTIWSNSFVLDK